jgi:argininosuccinate synthase
VSTGEAGEITEHAAPYDADREALADATDAAGESAAFDFGSD